MNKHNIEKERKDLKPMITLFKAHQSLSRVVKDDIRQYGFDLNEFAVLEVMYHHHKLKVSDINDKVLVNSSSLTYILDKLVKKNLIVRTKDSVDKRVIFIEITEQGKELGLSIFPDHYKLLNEIFDIFDDNEKEVMVKLLKKIGLNANKYGDK